MALTKRAGESWADFEKRKAATRTSSREHDGDYDDDDVGHEHHTSGTAAPAGHILSLNMPAVAPVGTMMAAQAISERTVALLGSAAPAEREQARERAWNSGNASPAKFFPSESRDRMCVRACRDPSELVVQAYVLLSEFGRRLAAASAAGAYRRHPETPEGAASEERHGEGLALAAIVPALGAVLSSDAAVVGGAELRRATHLLMELQLADTRVTGELLKVWAGIQMAPSTAAVASLERLVSDSADALSAEDMLTASCICLMQGAGFSRGVTYACASVADPIQEVDFVPGYINCPVMTTTSHPRGETSPGRSSLFHAGRSLALGVRNRNRRGGAARVQPEIHRVDP
jgi:hypothetical protein